MKYTLEQLGIECRCAETEAYRAISIYVNSQPNTYAYGDDTDFFAFGIPYIQFQDLQIKKTKPMLKYGLSWRLKNFSISTKLN